MASKVKSKWVCQSCGYESFSYLGKCPNCNEYASFEEEVEQTSAKIFKNVVQIPITSINEIEASESIRIKSGYDELDRVLGGGFVEGSLVLFAGDPGIGKSTLILQSCKNIAEQNKKILYVCAEESITQVKLRAKRLFVNSDNLFVTANNCLDEVIAQIDTIKPDFLVVDSIQAVYCEGMSASSGSVSQIRECTNILMRNAKQKNITTVVIGHVTKEGNIAGPKVLEHMVDCVINLEGDKYKACRLLRSVKNRFGATCEIGIFDMQDEGLVEVKNPSELFLRDKNHEKISGSTVIATLEGTRVLLLEVQALVGSTPYPNPRRVGTGVEYNRLLQIIAVLEKRVGLNLSKQDVYVNIIGGIDIIEPSADLGIALAILTCAKDVVISPDTVIIGEIGLNSEIRSVSQLELRIKEAQKLGFKNVVVPNIKDSVRKKIKDLDINVVEVSKIIDAVKAINNFNKN